MSENENLFSSKSLDTSITKNNYYKDLLKSILKKPSFLISCIILFSLFTIGFFIDTFIDKDVYFSINFDDSFISPNKEHWFGTNDFGQDMFCMIFTGIYNTLKLSLAVTLINLGLGTIIGIIWGSNPKFDYFFIFIKNILDNIPIIFFYIIIISSLNSNLMSLLIVLVIFGWINIACLVRNNFLLIRNRNYNVASKLFKTPFHKRVINNYIPSIIPIIFNSFAISVPEIISLEITIYYFGFLSSNQNICLGKILYHSIYTNNWFIYPYLILIPFIFVFIINLCFYFIGKTISFFALKRGGLDVKNR